MEMGLGEKESNAFSNAGGFLSCPLLFLWWILMGWRHSLRGRRLSAILFDGIHVRVLYSILRAFSLPNCFAALTPISHIPPIPSCCGLFRFRQPARPPAWGAGYTTHVQVASVEFAGPMEHLFILTQNKRGDSKENGHISDLTSLPSSFSLHPNDRN